MTAKIKRLEYNWFYTEDGDTYGFYEVGLYGVIEIREAVADFEGDKWYYSIEFKDGHREEVFNPNKVIYFKKGGKE